MKSHMSNIEAVSRSICERIYHQTFGDDPGSLMVQVDRHWHCVAAELEAGLIDETGRPCRDYDFDEGFAAYRDWRARHPDYEAPRPPRR